MDFTALRLAFRAERTRQHLSLQEVSRRTAIGGQTPINKSTIFALESVAKKPHLQSDLETLDRLARALGSSLAQLLARLEQVPAPLVGRRRRDTTRSSPVLREERDGRVFSETVDSSRYETLLLAVVDTIVERVRTELQAATAEIRADIATRAPAAGPPADAGGRADPETPHPRRRKAHRRPGHRHVG